MDRVFSYSQLLKDLHTAYYDARRHKRNKLYQIRFETDLENNLQSLCTELWWRTYEARPSESFIIEDPKKREIFAADFRDRIVHHLYYNYLYRWFERTFVADSYSCILRRGTHYGIHRLEHHIRCESHDYTRKCYVLKMDLQGYFMHIDRRRLLDIAMSAINKLQRRGVTDLSMEHFDFLRYLTREIVLLDPTENCRIRGSIKDWDGLPESKSLFSAPPDCGLPIGNLTSQLFSNVYLNELDQYMKRTLHCRHYGRYVDDFYVVSCDREWLKGLIPKVRAFLEENLGLYLQDNKMRLCDVQQGVEYLGAYLKPHRRYVSNFTLRRINKKITRLEQTLPNPDPEHLRSSLSSILGIMRHHSSFRLRQQLVQDRLQPFLRYGYFDRELTKFIPYKPFLRNIFTE